MLNLFKSDRLAKAYKAIQTGDTEQLLKQLKKISPDEINQPVSDTIPGLVESCVLEQQPKALELVLKHGASANTPCLSHSDLSLATLALQKEKSLPLLTQLLQAGCKEDKQELLHLCFEQCDEQQLMLHISLLLQSGAQLDAALLHKGLQTGQLPLIHFLVNSGAPVPEDIEQQGYSDEIISYAKRCAEDLKIRKMFL